MSKKKPEALKSDTFHFPNGDIYTGEYKSTPAISRHGQGSYYSAETGTSISGTWQDDILIGQGEINFSNGDSYKGTCKSDRYDGKGTYKFQDGIELEGSWIDNCIQGDIHLRNHEQIFTGIFDRQKPCFLALTIDQEPR